MNEQEKSTSSQSPNLKLLKKNVIIRLAIVFLFLCLMFFLPAWTLEYWQAWTYIFVLSIPAIIIIRYLYKHDPQLLERRMRMKEKQKAQKLIVAVGWVFFLAAFIIPGFDHRLHWSNVSLAIIILSDALVLLGYLIVALVFKSNTYTSRIIEVEKDQEIITTGPYAFVRHPMYLGVLILYVFSPLALGSYWAVIPALFLIPLIVARIIGEEEELAEKLGGYKEFMLETKYRLIPRIW